jgi:hypothetical protein
LKRTFTDNNLTFNPSLSGNKSLYDHDRQHLSKECCGRPQLMLDIGGVLFTNLSPRFWILVAQEAGVGHETLYRQYKGEISAKLWIGEISEDQFWGWLLAFSPKLDLLKAKQIFADCLIPLPALARLPQWGRIADVHLLSNHLLSWVAPLLQPVQASLSHILVSSEIGWKKPQRELFAHAAALLPPHCPVLFVDGTTCLWRNLLAGASCRRTNRERGWMTWRAGSPPAAFKVIKVK